MDIVSLQEFYRGFYIDHPRGNNAFSFDQRVLKRIYVPSLIKGDLEAVMAGDEVVFCDLIDPVCVGATSGRPPEGNPNLPARLEVQAKGLKHFVHIERPGQNIFVFDNHNHAFSFWVAGVYDGLIPMGSTLVHVDQHKDTRQPASWLTGTGLLDACGYANDVLNVGNFISPAIKMGWFGDVVQVGSVEAFQICIPAAFVLDIDLDIFAPVMDYIPEELKVSCLRAWISRASLVTIATSPFFMDQNQALHYLHRLL